jgi:hypothetical protein
MNENTDYSKLRLDVLEKMIFQRGIECKMKKDEMIRMLKLYDEGKYVEPLKETIYYKDGDGFNVGVDLKNENHLLQVSKLLEKKEGKSLNRFAEDRIWYWIPNKLI